VSKFGVSGFEERPRPSEYVAEVVFAPEIPKPARIIFIYSDEGEVFMVDSKKTHPASCAEVSLVL